METSALDASNFKEAFYNFIKGVLTLNPDVELNKNYSSNYSSTYRRLASMKAEKNNLIEEEFISEEESRQQEEEISVTINKNSVIGVLGTGKIIIIRIKITSSFYNSQEILVINGGKVIKEN